MWDLVRSLTVLTVDFTAGTGLRLGWPRPAGGTACVGAAGRLPHRPCRPVLRSQLRAEGHHWPRQPHTVEPLPVRHRWSGAVVGTQADSWSRLCVASFLRTDANQEKAGFDRLVSPGRLVAPDGPSQEASPALNHVLYELDRARSSCTMWSARPGPPAATTLSSVFNSTATAASSRPQRARQQGLRVANGQGAATGA